MTSAGSRAGPLLFARYGFPPHELGYCGPADAEGLAELARRAREFDGAWPYLEALGDAGGLDPLHEDVVQAYWVGGDLVDQVNPQMLLGRLRNAFAEQRTGVLDRVQTALPHHSFHVLAIYPWVTFLKTDPVTPLGVLQQCRIRWGRVASVDDEHVVIEARPLTFDGHALALGDAVPQQVRWQESGQSLVNAPRPGTWVSAHWNWICDKLTSADVSALEAHTLSSLALVNAALDPTEEG